MKRELKNEMFDAMLRSALKEYAQSPQEELQTRQEMIDAGEELHQFSPEFEQKMERLKKQTRRKNWRKSHRRTFQRVAAMFAVVILSGSVLVYQVDALRVPVMNFIISVQDAFSEITFGEPESPQGISDHFDQYLPTYMPDGFIIESVEETQQEICVTYSHEDGRFYSVVCENEVQNGAFDTEDAQVNEIHIRDYPAVLIEKMRDGYPHTQIVWATKQGGYYLSGYLTEEEAVLVLESVEIIF